MKKKVFVVLFFALLSVSSTSSFAASVHWEKSTPIPRDPNGVKIKEVFSLTTETGEICTIENRLDGNLGIYAVNNNWYGKTVGQRAIIAEKDGFIQNSSTIYDGKSKADPNYSPIKALDYDVFTEECAPYSGELPEYIKKKFQGKLGVK